MSRKDVLSMGLLALGLVMAASPWLVGFSGNDAAALSACGIAALVMLAALAGLAGRDPVAAAGALTIGAWSMTEPILLGLVADAAAFVVHVAGGAAAMLLAATSVDWRPQGPPEMPV